MVWKLPRPICYDWAPSLGPMIQAEISSWILVLPFIETVGVCPALSKASSTHNYVCGWIIIQVKDSLFLFCFSLFWFWFWLVVSTISLEVWEQRLPVCHKGVQLWNHGWTKWPSQPFFKIFFYISKNIYITQNLPFYLFLSVQFTGINYIHNVM